MTSNLMQAREPAGSPDGGQFGSTARAEAGTSLVQPSTRPAPTRSPLFVDLEQRSTAIPSWPSAGIVDARVFAIGDDDEYDGPAVHALTHYAPNRVRSACGVQAPVVESDGPKAYWRDSNVTCEGCLKHAGVCGHGFDIGGVPVGFASAPALLDELASHEWDDLEATIAANYDTFTVITDDAKYDVCHEAVADALGNDGWWDPEGQGRPVVDLTPILCHPVSRLDEQLRATHTADYLVRLRATQTTFATAPEELA